MLNNLDIAQLKSEKIVLAVSGGSDSMALLQLCVKAGFENLHVVTVDHGLRKAAKDEVAFVKAVCAGLNIPHQTVCVVVDAKGNLQANARQVRYDALIAHAKKIGSQNVFLGHTADDQAETFLLRAFRGSGVDGLSGMPSSRLNNGITFSRPLIDKRREDLRGELTRVGQTWIDDPSNDDNRFDRVKMRKLLSASADAGFDIAGILQSAENMARAKSALDEMAEQFAHDQITILPLDVELQIAPEPFRALPMAIATKILGECCKIFGGSIYLPRRDGIDRLYELIKSHEEGGMAVAGTDFHWSKNRIRVCAEFAALPSKAIGMYWHRWQAQANGALHIGALGDHIDGFDHWRALGISHRAARTLPALFEGETVIYVHGQKHNEIEFTLVKDQNSSII